MPYLSIGVLEKRRDAKIKELQNINSLMQGSISTVKTTCGKANCKCARGEKHESNILTKKVNGKTKTLYIPKDMVKEVTLCVQENKKLRKLQKEIAELNERILKKFVKTKRAKKKNLNNIKKIKKSKPGRKPNEKK